MTQERKDKVYDQMISWICEHIGDDDELYDTLCEQFGMTLDELHDNCIDTLDDYFSGAKDNLKPRLKEKIAGNLDGFKEKWLAMSKEQLIDHAEEIGIIGHMAEMIPAAASEHETEYLLRFKNPLEVVSDYWLYRNSLEVSVADDEMSHILYSILDTRDAENDYEMETPDDEESEGVSITM